MNLLGMMQNEVVEKARIRSSGQETDDGGVRLERLQVRFADPADDLPRIWGIEEGCFAAPVLMQRILFFRVVPLAKSSFVRAAPRSVFPSDENAMTWIPSESGNACDHFPSAASQRVTSADPLLWSRTGS